MPHLKRYFVPILVQAPQITREVYYLLFVRYVCNLSVVSEEVPNIRYVVLVLVVVLLMIVVVPVVLVEGEGVPQ